MPDIFNGTIDEKIWDSFNGIALVIDDKVDGDNDKITDIVSQLNALNIPLLTYKQIPSNDTIKHLRGISFVILDWKLQLLDDADKEAGVTLPESAYLDNNVEFIKQVQLNLQCPIFIISNESSDGIRSFLKDKNLIYEGKPNFIFVADKGVNIKKSIVEWTKESAVIYTLKTFSHSLFNACNETFLSLYTISAEWPNIFFSTSEADKVDFSYDMLNLISANIKSRMKFNLETSYFKNIAQVAEDSHSEEGKKRPREIKKDISQLVAARTFLAKDFLPSGEVYAGDIFLIDGHYYINIRPTCDSIRGEELYLLEGSIVPAPNSNKKWKEDYNESHEHNGYLVLCCHESKHIKFQFKIITTKPTREILPHRIGRLLHPYITDLQRHFANYISRPGVYRKLGFKMLYGEAQEDSKEDTFQ